MKFEITYSDTSKVQVDIPDTQLLALLDQSAKSHAIEITNKVEVKRGTPVSCKVV